jgi:hypothetical protein
MPGKFKPETFLFSITNPFGSKPRSVPKAGFTPQMGQNTLPPVPPLDNHKCFQGWRQVGAVVARLLLNSQYDPPDRREQKQNNSHGNLGKI